ncbi:protein PTST homolog 3, chloroplastic isoform X1 [Citrus clementina]|uniref:protein PTST homolog 3, chloroplastic isoform X1 n=2 Tax=Citrus clementina TaxID=85681 RepID=UPI000CECE7CB|nr:protein PTST homolog 3, chloroplastic isoform X1 [Citrus x clementina]
MATLFLSSSFLLPLSSHKLWQWHPPRKHLSFTICCASSSSSNKSSSSSSSSSRSSRKVKSNEELYNDLREFLSTVGLSESHVPSMKELSAHGRDDLANIVRRRGYKYIRQLLKSSTKPGFNGFVAEKSLAGQDEKVANEVEDVSLSVEVSSETESSNLNCQNKNVDNSVENISLSTDVSFVKNPSKGSCINTDLHSDVYSLPPTESLSDPSFVGEVSPNLNGHYEKAGNVTETFSSLADSSILENHSSSSNINPSLNLDEHGYLSLQSSDMEEKVANFIQNGDLDIIDDRAMILNGSALTSKQIASFATVNHPLSEDHLGTGVEGADFDSSEVEVIARRRENQLEIDHLKFMLHQKEMELSRLKEQIEKEKLALSVLQTKAVTEINKAEKLISDKDEELIAAEESLSGLEVVEIQYSGDGEIVEVAGSFNGWHHRIKMDPLPSSSIIEPIRSRKSRLWSTVLWLYPGTYEIKFIVDGQWKVDPQRESVTKGGICNNILRVI